ncbi:UDP-N-acetylmuramoyl-L-alanine--D-glutamate ligase [Candidatus Microgenomates bacterium]|nr:UDP-N-acetylmuramoyl-L-alanine--D-glutamate ligase [Candidatus Microgenomates bacterium]
MNYKNKHCLASYIGKKIAILGHGIEGQDAEKFLKKQGALITVLDQKADKNYLKNLERFDMIVRSPGVYRYKKEIVKAQKSGVRIASPIHIFFDEFGGIIIGVTGTKGKGTTSTLICDILRKSGSDVFLAGNIGKPFLELLPKLNSKSIVVLELSSFQLIDLTVSPDIAVVLNITSDHLDWHKNQKEYVEAKTNIVKHQNSDDWAVINKEYKVSKSFAKLTKANKIFFSKNTLEKEYKKGLKLKGEHNLENIAAAVSVAKILNIKKEIIQKVVKNFKGLEHRLELVKTVNGITFYNDSFATGPQPTIAAIRSFSEPITLILGGSEKGHGFSELAGEITKSSVSNVVVIGEIREKIIKALTKAKFQGDVHDLGTQTMKKIVIKTLKTTPKGGVVILSPAAASFDMFDNYKDRGNQFKKEVQKLHGSK